MKISIHYTFVFLFCLGASALSANDTTWNAKGRYGFIENKGQVVDQNYKSNPEVLFLLPGNGLNIQLKQTGFAYDTYTIERFTRENKSEDFLFDKRHPDENDSLLYHYHRIDVEWLNANPHAKLITKNKSQDYINYYTAGTPEKGVPFVHHYQKVVYENLWPKIDLEFELTQSGPKYNFTVHPGGDLANIQWRYKGAAAELKEGNIVLTTTNGEMQESIPLSMLLGQGEQKPINVNYTQHSSGHFGFETSENYTNQTLWIDPVPILLWSSYFGGNSPDSPYGSDFNEQYYVCGTTGSVNFISTTGAHQISLGGGVWADGYLLSLNEDGSRFWST